MLPRLHPVPEHESSVGQAPGTKSSQLSARTGDRLVIRGHHVGEPQRDGEILEVLGEKGAPPYLVRWTNDDHVSRVFPGSDAFVERPARRRRR